MTMTRTALIAVSILCLGNCLLRAQSETVTGTGSLNISEEIRPPVLRITDIRFEDPSGNNAFDAGETCWITMSVRNEGFGDGVGLKGVIRGSGSVSGLSYGDIAIKDIAVGKTETVRFPITASTETEDGRAEFALKIEEPMGFGTDEVSIAVDTRKFENPMVRLVDYSVTGQQGSLKKMQVFNLQILVQNTEHGRAQDVSVDMELPSGVFLMDGDAGHSFSSLGPGETVSLEYALIVNNDYSSREIPIHFGISESYGLYAENKDITLTLDQQLASHMIEIESVAGDDPGRIEVASLRSDVDRNIPVTGTVHPDRFAIIIGNEDYHSYQKGLSDEADVPFAANDAAVFARYCESVMGVPKDNIVLLTNARWSDMNREINRITGIVSLRGGDAELILYYAGHGFPDADSKEAYLIPVDISGTDYESGFRLSDLYARLSATGAGRITVFMDACFSGGGRRAGLLAARGVRVVPKETPLKGNLVVFSATTDDQVALPYTEKQHGMFTYFLLKKLQETSGDCTYSELSDYLLSEVSEYSLRINYKQQNPETACSYEVEHEWEEWKFN